MATIVVAAALVMVNLIGYRPTANSVWIRWWCGWPIAFAQRQIEYGQVEPYSRWFHSDGVVYLSFPRLLAEVLFAISVLAGVGWISEKRFRESRIAWRFSLRSTFAMTAWIGCCALLLQQSRIDLTSWHLCYHLLGAIGTIIVLGGIFLAWLAAFDMADAVWNWIVDRRRKKN